MKLRRCNRVCLRSLSLHASLNFLSVQEGGFKECEPWDRCWCLLEMAVRDYAVSESNGKTIGSRIVISSRYTSSSPVCLLPTLRPL